jgi:hypothetical protein
MDAAFRFFALQVSKASSPYFLECQRSSPAGAEGFSLEIYPSLPKPKGQESLARSLPWVERGPCGAHLARNPDTPTDERRYADTFVFRWPLRATNVVPLQLTLTLPMTLPRSRDSFPVHDGVDGDGSN